MDPDDEVSEHTLLLVREVSVYKVPRRSTSGGYKCAEWLVSSKIWSGRLRVVSVKDVCEIRLEDPSSGELFATCRVLPGQREASVQSAVDSSRFFVLKIDDGRGRHAFIGLGFSERNEAFDFNVAVTDHEKHVLNERARPQAPAPSQAPGLPQGPVAPSADFRLKEGETIRINMKPKSSGAAENKLGLGGVAAGGSLRPLAPPPGGGGGLRLAPPPGGGGGIKLAPPPSSSNTAPLAPPPTSLAPPASSGSSQKSTSSGTAGGWTSF